MKVYEAIVKAISFSVLLYGLCSCRTSAPGSSSGTGTSGGTTPANTSTSNHSTTIAPVLIRLLTTPSNIPFEEMPDPSKQYFKKEFVHDRFPNLLFQLMEDEKSAISKCNSSELARVQQEHLLHPNGAASFPRPCHVFYRNKPNSQGHDVVGDVAKEQKIIDQILKNEF